MDKKFNKLIEENEKWIIEKRRYFHAHPEPSRKEHNTSKKIVKILDELDIEYQSGYYNTGVVGLIRGKKNNCKTIAIRCDIDALEIGEKNNVEYASKEKGLMHACGHDGHIAMGLGAAKVLNEMKDKFKGNIKIIFQPAEEDAPNGGGAQYMIEEEVLKAPDVDAIIGMHLWPNLEFGKVATKSGVIMGASDPFTINITGKGVHASQPYLGIDPIVIGAEIISNIQTIVSRNIDPFEQAVISIGVFKGGTRYNAIPETVTLEGTVRTFDDSIREIIYEKLRNITEKTASGLGGKAVLDYIFSYPPLINNEKVFLSAKKAIINSLGENNFVELVRPAPTGEDFAFFAKKKPACFMWLGTGKKGEEKQLHSPYFDFDDTVLKQGVKVFVNTALELLNDRCDQVE
ncbi:MAG TPA: M20 family metallopeptidase [Halanaerobiales bacterium]|nr:M20 family metallopeptidase [Halanaerobiales bacterium]